MFHHIHPYEPFFPKGATKLIVGTLPPPRFTTGDLNNRDVDFCYGSSNGLLWPVLDQIFSLKLEYNSSADAVQQRKDFLTARGIGVCDIVRSCKRDKIDASDIGMQAVQLRDVIGYLKKYPKIDTLLFTGGNSKNGPEYFFRKQLKIYQIPLAVVSNTVPRIHEFTMPQEMERKVRTISLTAPSGAANRAIGSLAVYKQAKQTIPSYTTMDFRVAQYRAFF